MLLYRIPSYVWPMSSTPVKMVAPFLDVEQWMRSFAHLHVKQARRKRNPKVPKWGGSCLSLTYDNGAFPDYFVCISESDY